MPELAGRLAGIALRVPVPKGSITDLVATLETEVSRDDVNSAFAEAAVDGSYRGVLRYGTEPLVSADIVGDPAVLNRARERLRGPRRFPTSPLASHGP
jgi:glyceraldehyde 3-phosphate dehydrogenase (phosphorylating)